jgi:hypothetical protein
MQVFSTVCMVFAFPSSSSITLLRRSYLSNWSCIDLVHWKYAYTRIYFVL